MTQEVSRVCGPRAMLLTLLFAGSALAQFSGGTGTAGSPYQIASCQELQAMQTALASYYVLLNDIDCGMTVTWNDGAGFEPVGTFSGIGDPGGMAFRGDLDGAGHVIRDLYIFRPSEDGVGLFAQNSRGSIHDVGLEDVSVTGRERVGALTGLNDDQGRYNTLIHDCYTTGIVRGSGCVGGIAGNNYDVVIANCYSTCDVLGAVRAIGGIVGCTSFSEVRTSYATGTMTVGGDYAGGLVGAASGTSFKPLRLLDCFATGQVFGDPTQSGGLAGGMGAFQVRSIASSWWYDWCNDDAVVCMGSPLSACGGPVSALPVLFDNSAAPSSAWNFMTVWGYPGGIAGVGYPCLQWEAGCQAPSSMGSVPPGAPVAVCRDIVVPLGAGGRVVLDPAAVDGGSYDPDGDCVTLTIDRDTFTCADAGASHPVSLTISDGSLQDVCVAMVTVVTGGVIAAETDPLHAQIDAPRDANVNVTFCQDLDPLTVDASSFTVYGQQFGRYPGVLSLPTPRMVSFDPGVEFLAGEELQVVLTRSIQSVAGVSLSPRRFGFRAEAGGCGGFGLAGSQALSMTDHVALAVADFTGDGHLDVAFATTAGGGNEVWVNDGLGGLTDSGQRLGGVDTVGLAAGDLDGNGSLDLFLVNDGGSPDLVFLNDGLGNLVDSGQTLGTTSSRDVALGDLDGDGDLDAFIVTASPTPNTIGDNDGLGNFALTAQALGDSDSRAVALGDMDGDGDLDAFVACNSGEPNEVWFGDPPGGIYRLPLEYGAATSTDVALGDLDGDGDLDAFVTNGIGQPDTVWFNRGRGALIDSGQALGANDSQGVSLGDADGDGDLDAFVAVSGAPDVLYENDGAGGFVDRGVALASSDSRAVALADLDADTDLDMLAATIGGQADLVHVNASQRLCGDCDQDGDVDVLDALRAAQFAVALFVPVPLDFCVCNVDGDMDIDVIDALSIAQAAAGLPAVLACP